MSDRLLTIVEDLQADTELASLSEAGVSQSIRRVLNALNWDADNRREVSAEYSVANRRVDYALLNGGDPQVFIEVKKGGEPLERHQEQLLDYAFKEGIQLAILTNGLTWWFYLPLRPGSWEQRKFTTMMLNTDDKTEIVQNMVGILSKEKVYDGSAFKNAAHLYEQMRRQIIIEEFMPKAWNQLMNELDGLIVARIAEKTDELCGHEPGENEVEKFLSVHLPNIQIALPTASTEPMVVPESEISGIEKGTRIRAFTFNGERREVNGWSSYVVEFCQMLSAIPNIQFEKKILEFRHGYGRTYFSTDKTAVRRPCPIPGTSIYVTRDLSADRANKLVEHLATYFGYNDKPTMETISL